MKDSNDIINYLFERSQNLFDFRKTDETFRNYSKILTKTKDNLNDFIVKRTPPCLHTKLQRLIEERECSFNDYYDRQNFLYYKKGFSDAISLIFLNFNSDIDCSI